MTDENSKADAAHPVERLVMRRIENDSIPSDWIPYRNRWGHWVWRREDMTPDPTWPGAKPPDPDAVPVFTDDAWHWVLPDDMSLMQRHAFSLGQIEAKRGGARGSAEGIVARHRPFWIAGFDAA